MFYALDSLDNKKNLQGNISAISITATGQSQSSDYAPAQGIVPQCIFYGMPDPGPATPVAKGYASLF